MPHGPQWGRLDYIVPVCRVCLDAPLCSWPAAVAVAHAIANATGVWINDLPITPEKILRAIREKRASPEADAAP